MSKTDELFIQNCKDILARGTWDTFLCVLGGKMGRPPTP